MPVSNTIYVRGNAALAVSLTLEPEVEKGGASNAKRSDASHIGRASIAPGEARHHPARRMPSSRTHPPLDVSVWISKASR